MAEESEVVRMPMQTDPISWVLLRLSTPEPTFGKEFPSRTFWRGPPRNCPLQALWCALCSTEQRAHFEGQKRATRCREKGRKRGGQQRGQKGKRTRGNRSENLANKLPSESWACSDACTSVIHGCMLAAAAGTGSTEWWADLPASQGMLQLGK